MTDQPLFVPTSEGPVGAVVSEPPRGARAGLFLIQGYGRPARSGTNSFWTRLARAFAERGVVVLRTDYAREGETLPLGEGTGGMSRIELDTRLHDEILPWFRERLGDLDLYVAGSCSGARGAIKLAGREHPDAVARTFLIVPHVQILRFPERNGGGTGHARELAEHEAVDPLMLECLRRILSRAPSWVLVGEHDAPDIPLLVRLLGRTEHRLEVEVVPNTALHFLDQPDLQELAGRLLIERVSRALADSGAG